jgi:hypothetical protein
VLRRQMRLYGLLSMSSKEMFFVKAELAAYFCMNIVVFEV